MERWFGLLTEKQLRRRVPDCLLPATLRPAEKRAIDLVSDWPWIALQDLAGMLGVSRQRASQVVIPLEALKLLARPPGAGGRLALTDWALTFLARWTARIGLGEQVVTTKTLRRRVLALAGRLTRSARRLTLHLPQHWPWETQFSRALARLRAIPLPAWRHRRCLSHPTDNRTSPPTRASPVREGLLLRPLPTISPCPTSAGGHRGPVQRLKTLRDLPSTPMEPRPSPL